MVSRLALALLAVATVSVVVEARVFHDGPFSTGRQLLQETNCPAGCDIDNDGCVRDSTEGGYRCIKCKTSLLVNNDDGKCYCPAGKYASATDTCTDCPKESYCEGGLYSAANSPDKVDCSTHSIGLTTIGRRSVSKKACVNKPGYKYISGTDPSAAQCDADTYGPGLRKQRECVPCAPGFKSDAGSDAAGDCVVPAGYFLKSPGQVAPCPRGEYKAGTAAAAACNLCATGVTTVGEASTSEAACVVVLPSFYPYTITTNIVKATKKCPQKYWCPGGTPTATFIPGAPNADEDTNLVNTCPDGTWTQNLGAYTVDECLTPPGHYTTTAVGGTGSTSKCAAGRYRAEWKPASAAASCDVCGDNIESEETDQITEYNTVTEAGSTVTVATTSGSCYIVAGQGMYFSPDTKLFRAANCETDNYGVSNKTTGLAAYPCRACPAGMQTSVSLTNSNTYHATNGFYDPKACVTKVGYGYNGRVATQCRPDSYNAAGNYGTCTQCPTGFTTNAVAATQAVATDCRLAEGYGFANGAVGLCPVGTFRSGIGPDETSGVRLNETCTACSTGTTTSRPGGRTDADCNLCLPGYGETNCANKCGLTAATYGPAGRPRTTADGGSPDCLTCPTMTVGFGFDVYGTNEAFAPLPIAREGAESAADCLASFAQIEDVAWYLGGSAALTTVPGANNFTACVADCTGDCQYVTFDYAAAVDQKCKKRTAVLSGTAGNVLAFKAVLSGDVAASSVTVKTLASGSYTFWKDDGTDVGASSTNSAGTTSACLAACDIDASCAAVKMTGVTADPGAAITSCDLVKGVSTVAQFKRSATRAVVTKLSVSAALA